MIQVKGKNELDTDLRSQALISLNTLPTKVLTRLVELSNSKAAIGYLETEQGFQTIKTFLSIHKK